MPHQQLGELARLGIDAPDALAQRLGPRRLGARRRLRARRPQGGWLRGGGRLGLRLRGGERLEFGLRGRGWLRNGERCGRRLGIADEEVLLAGAAGRAEPRTDADALAAVGAKPRLRPCHLASSARLRALAAWGGITSRRWTAGEPSFACSQPSGPRRASPRWSPRRPRRRAPRPARPRSCSPSTRRARWRQTTAAARRRSRRHRTLRLTSSARCRPRRGRAARLRRHQALAPDRPRVPRLEPRPAHRPARPLPGRAADPLVQGQGPHPDRLRPRARCTGPRDLRAPDDHPRLRRQGHLPAALAVRGRPAHRQGRRRDAHPGHRLQR